MQEEVESRTVALTINTTKLTARVLTAAISKYLAYRKAKKPGKPVGKQTVRELIGQNAGVSNIEVTEGNIKGFDRVARKYGVDYAIKKDKTGDIPKYLVFFKARDADALTAAFTEYTAKQERKPSLVKLIHSLATPGLGRDIARTRTRSRGIDR